MALLLLCAFSALLAGSQVLAQSRSSHSQALVRSSNSEYTNQRYSSPQIEEPTPDISKDYDLLDIVLVASVDGKFHALNRTSGHVLWSMSSFATTTSVSAPSSLSPLVRTSHTAHDPDLEDDVDHETYVIEPQSGYIYVLPSSSAALQRFPFTMSELVDMSPFTSVNDNDTRVFVGRKETSLLLIELETGKIKATLNAECPFIPDEYENTEIDLDELEGSKPPVSAPTEVYIGRTDYIITIHKKPKPGMPAIPPQELSFSTYGPNNKDNHLQSIYHHTQDDMYIQSLTNGEIIAFQTKARASKENLGGEDEPPSGQALWGHPFNTPIVAIFDVLQPLSTPSHHARSSHPLVLLQPRPRLQDLFPKLSSGPGSSDPLLRKLSSAYVGIVEETGSLFAMSAERYPLVVFAGTDRPGLGMQHGSRGVRKWRAIDPPRSDGVDGREPETGLYSEADLEYCLDNPYDPRCLVGVRPFEQGDGVADRMKRLIDGPKTQMSSEQQPMGGQHRDPSVVEINPLRNVIVDDSENSSGAHDRDRGILEISGPSSSGPRSMIVGTIGPGDYFGQGLGGIWEAVVVTALFALLTVWLVWAKVKAKVGFGSPTQLPQIAISVERELEKSAEKQPIQVPISVPIPQDTPEVEQTVTPTDQPLLQPEIPISQPPPPPVPPSLPPPVVDQPVESTPQPAEEVPAQPLVVPEPVPETPLAPAFTPVDAVPDTPTLNLTPPAAGGDDGEESEPEVEGATPTPGRKKRPRGKRGKKKKGNGVANGSAGDSEVVKEVKEEEEKKPSAIVLSSSSPKPSIIPQPSLIVSDTILGFGSHGTVVYQGSLQGRAVAVKRLLQDFVTLAAREVSILQESDDHPNVIRYYYQEMQGNFLYIALELCPASLADIIENPDKEQWRDIAISFDPKKALKQITSGLRHLHALKLVHRDIKPQNILVSSAKTGGFGARGGPGGKSGGYRVLISDFGLCKKLDSDQTSFLPTAHGAMGAGTVGWRAPEILRGEVKLDELATGDDASLSSRGSVSTVNGSSQPSTGNPTRLTKSVDIFALGCLFYYTLTNGGHPYGDRFEREVNIMRDEKDLSGLERYGEEGTEAKNLIESMLSFEARARPDTTKCLLHPFFWDPGRRLNFLQDASDRFEIMCRDPKDQNLIVLETGAQGVVGNDWHARLDKIFIENLGKYRKYDGRSVQDLLRALRNKKHHYQDLPDNVKRHLGPMPEGFLGYFTRRYPQLFLHVHGVIQDTGLHSESMFRTYFELPDS